MSLDFVVLDQDGAPKKTVSLGVDLHHEMISAALVSGLTRFQDFSDYYEDAEISVDDLPGLGEQVHSLRAQVSSVGLQTFLDELSDLIIYARSNGKTLHAIAD